MKFLKSLGYYALFLLYYIVVFACIVLTFEPMDSSQGVGPIGLFMSLAAIASPFLVVRFLINRFCPRVDKKKHAVGLATTLILLMILHAIGTYFSKGGFTQLVIPFYAFNLCLIISLYVYKENRNEILITSDTQPNL